MNYQERELATIAALSSLQGVEPQLKSHIKVGLYNGLTPEQVQDILTITKSCDGKKILKEILGQKIFNDVKKGKKVNKSTRQAQIEVIRVQDLEFS